MKARVKATGKIAEVEFSHYIGDVAWYKIKGRALYSENELEFIDVPEDYWTRLEHQYAGMVMQGVISRVHWPEVKDIIEYAAKIAHALVEKYKKEDSK